MTYHELLNELAACHGVATTYMSSTGEEVPVTEATKIKTLHALGVEVEADEASISAALERFYDRQASRPLPPCVVAVCGYEYVFHVHVHDGAEVRIWIELEDGTHIEPLEQRENWNPPRVVDGQAWGEASFVAPPTLPLGWHRIHMISESVHSSCQLIVTPQRLSTADKYVDNPTTGVMAQLYSVRSEDSWGMGDFHDLGELAEMVAKTAGADYLLVNPMHAAQPFPPIEDSPYLPTTRRFHNPLYLRVEDIPEFEQLDEELVAEIAELSAPLKGLSADPIKRSPIYQAKLQVLRELYALPHSEERREAFKAYVEREGKGLKDFARWCAECEVDAGLLPAHAIEPDTEELGEFYMWLQFLCDEQLAAAQERALAAGMSIGIMADLAVGVHPGGADAHNLASVLAPAASVGAPADNYNQQGQDWSQPPWHPEKLAEDAYRPWRDLVRTMVRHAGGIRVDHVLGLFRLFWIPRGETPLDGTYVRYSHEALVGILALEAERAGAVVIGEDLGTFEPWVQDVLSERGILGTSLLWFEGSPQGDGPRRQEEYRSLALASIGSHDLPPCAGCLDGEHIRLREELGILTRPEAVEDEEDLEWQNEVLDRVAEAGCFAGTALAGTEFEGLARGERGDTTDLLIGLHRFVAGTASALTCTLLVDMVGDRRAQNQPGTTNDLYPNWCVPLCDAEGTPLYISQLPELELYQQVAEAAKR